MKNLLLSLFFFLLGAQVSLAAALPDQTVESTTLHLVGRGIALSKGDESLGLACLDTQCTQLRFVLFKAQSASYFIGDILNAPLTSRANQTEAAFDFLVREYFACHHTLESAQKIDHGISRNNWISIGSAIVVGAAIPVPIVGFVTAGAIYAGGQLLSTSSDAMNAMATQKRSVATLNDQNGWSWAENPVKVKADVFTSVLDRIRNGRLMSHFITTVPGSYDRNEIIEKRLLRERTRLESKGITFPQQTWSY